MTSTPATLAELSALNLLPAPTTAPPPLAGRATSAGLRLDLAGPEALSTLELLDVLLGRRATLGVRGRAGAGALERGRDTQTLARAGVRELVRDQRLTRAQARRLVAACALGRRLASRALELGQALRTTTQVYEAFAPGLRGARREEFVSVLLDAKNRVLHEDRVSRGTLTSSLVHPREVFATAIRESAAALILIHNHPSGDPEPSPEDEAVTRRLVAVGELVGIPVLDHLVFGDGCYVSLLERGLVPALRGSLSP